MTQPISWKFTLVTKPFKQLRVLRMRNGRKDNLHGTYPQGFACSLMLGDRVFHKEAGKRWTKMFELCLLPADRSGATYPCIKYGRAYGPYKGQYRALANLPPAAFENAGVDPSWNTQ